MATASPEKLSQVPQGILLSTQKQTSFPLLEKQKGWVLVFLSAVCPCSDSHVEEVRQLSEKYRDYQFLGIHSNVVGESKVKVLEYFIEKKKLPFPVIHDFEQKMAEDLGASQTPHAYIVDMKMNVLYRGGVSNHSTFSKDNVLFLRQALDDLNVGKKVTNATTRVLGCVIQREKDNEWKTK